jgi:membrane fusion protein, multidrug efflux system
MSADSSQSSPKPSFSARLRASRRARVLFLLTTVALIAMTGWGIRWAVYGRFQENTEDAYVKADSMTVAPKVGGYVEAVYVQDNQWVKKGTALVRLDNRQYQAAQDKAIANIAAGRADIVQAEAEIGQQQAQLDQTRAQFAKARLGARHADEEWKRYEPLAVTGAATAEKLAELKDNRDQAIANLAVNAANVKAAQEQLASSQAGIAAARARLGVAEADMRRSRLDVGDTVLYSTMDGKVGDRGVRVGQLVQPGTRLMTIVPMNRLYVIANFKETQIGRMRIGQPVRLVIDALPGADIHGRVESFSPGTGAEFALLPPENATGNFTKIVQRVPVRIRIESADRDARLMPGLSVAVEVDTRGGHRG